MSEKNKNLESLIEKLIDQKLSEVISEKHDQRVFAHQPNQDSWEDDKSGPQTTEGLAGAGNCPYDNVPGQPSPKEKRNEPPKDDVSKKPDLNRIPIGGDHAAGILPDKFHRNDEEED